MPILKKVIHIIVIFFALVGLAFTGVFFAMKLGLTNAASGIEIMQEEHLGLEEPLYDTDLWSESKEWQVFKTAIKRDIEKINSAGKQAGVSPRLIMSIAAVEQLRLFYNERAVFEQVFSPLKILGVQSQFSWGVMGMKQETAITIEKHLKEGTSPYYLGKAKENMLDFKVQNENAVAEERFARLTAEDDNSWSYLYAGLSLKQFERQWDRAGFPIDEMPGVLATLYNIGYQNSKPHETPRLGGALIEFKKRNYTFGALAHDVYYSDELLEEFPR